MATDRLFEGKEGKREGGGREAEGRRERERVVGGREGG